jgi:Tat protein secretion system quality control protein TatD with DNase activity
MFIDIHCHLDQIKDLNGLVQNARDNNVRAILTNATNIESLEKTLEIARKFEEIKSLLGLHPADLLWMEQEARDRGIS